MLGGTVISAKPRRLLLSTFITTIAALAFGAVDLTTNEIYYHRGEPYPKDRPFALRVRKATRLNGTYDSLERELEALSMDPADVKFVRENLTRAVGATAEVLGRLRSSMGDVHGSKPALQRMVRTCIKLASVITGLLEAPQ